MNITQEENVLKFFLIIILFVVLLCVFIITLVFKYQKKRLDYLSDLERIKSESANTLLQSQLEIQEQTFLHISREIHDNIGQKLTLAKLYLNTIPNLENYDQLSKIRDSLKLISESILGLSELSRGMSTDFLLNNGLVKAIEKEVLILNRSGVFNAEFQVVGEERYMEGNTELVIFRIVQECIQNFVKHADAKNLFIRLHYHSNNIFLEISDDGIGLNAKSGSGAGFINMKRRAAMLGGTFVAEGDGKGTRINVNIPV